MKRREKNRVAAQKSRKRQTQRADLLHEVRDPSARLCMKPGCQTCGTWAKGGPPKGLLLS